MTGITVRQGGRPARPGAAVFRNTGSNAGKGRRYSPPAAAVTFTRLSLMAFCLLPRPQFFRAARTAAGSAR